MEQLEGRVAVVTGAASGIGFGLAERFAAEGMRVALADIEPGALDDAVARLRASGTSAIGVVTDVADPSAVARLAARTVGEFGAVHVVCNNAGVDTGAAFEDFPPDTFRWILDVNLRGVINGCRVFLPLLRAQDEGHIVNTSSTVTALGYMPTGTAYVTSKFAISGFTEALHREGLMLRDSVGVSLLIPGPVDTNIPDAERNLPEGVTALKDDPSRLALVETLRQGGVEGLMPPSEVAALVVDAIRTRRFHVITHPDPTIDAFQGRLEWMRTGRLPAPSPILQTWDLDR